MQFTIIVFENGSIIQTLRTHKRKRFLRILRTINWQNSMIKVYMKVLSNYSHFYQGKKIRAYNDGTFINKEDFLLAAEAFMED